MLGNFDFMVSDARIDTYPDHLYSPCEKAERYYADGDYQTSIGQCRTALDSIVQWMFASDDFPDLPNSFFGTLDDRMHHPAFNQTLHDSWLLNKLDNVRLLGNLAIHNGNGDFSTVNALNCLRDIFELMLNIEKQIWEYPYTGAFFEPCLEPEPVPSEYVEPEYRDLQSLMTECAEAGDAEGAAKYALLLSESDPSIQITNYAAALPEHTPIRDLIRMLTNRAILKARVDAGPYVVNSLVSRCYGEFPWWEKDIIIKLCADACRQFVTSAENEIEETLQKLAALQ